MRQILLDTETTGLDPKQGHRIIEIGCVEMVKRRLTKNNYHSYLNPQRLIDDGAMQVHGISNEFLDDKPLFADCVDEFLNFVKDTEVIIHNAPFDVGFINYELRRLGTAYGKLEDYCQVTDTLAMARKLHPGQKNNLDALCKRYNITHFSRDLHGALLDSEILAQVYLLMSGGQESFFANEQEEKPGGAELQEIKRVSSDRQPLSVIQASADELSAHVEFLQKLSKKSGQEISW